MQKKKKTGCLKMATTTTKGQISLDMAKRIVLEFTPEQYNTSQFKESVSAAVDFKELIEVLEPLRGNAISISLYANTEEGVIDFTFWGLEISVIKMEEMNDGSIKCVVSTGAEHLWKHDKAFHFIEFDDEEVSL